MRPGVAGIAMGGIENPEHNFVQTPKFVTASVSQPLVCQLCIVVADDRLNIVKDSSKPRVRSLSRAAKSSGLSGQPCACFDIEVVTMSSIVQITCPRIQSPAAERSSCVGFLSSFILPQHAPQPLITINS